MPRIHEWDLIRVFVDYLFLCLPPLSVDLLDIIPVNFMWKTYRLRRYKPASIDSAEAGASAERGKGSKRKLKPPHSAVLS
jgi:hypothetical protein